MCQAVANQPNPNPNHVEALWTQFKELLRGTGLRVTADGKRLLNDVQLKIVFHQWITDGAGARGNHNRTPACHIRDMAHVTPQHKELRQCVLDVLGLTHLRFGSFPGFRGKVVDDLVKAVDAGLHNLSPTQLKERTGICGPDPYHSDVTPMDSVRINPGVWHLFATWARFFLARLAIVMHKCGKLSQWVHHMQTCVKVIGRFKFWPLSNGGFEVYGADSGWLRNWLATVSGMRTFSCDAAECVCSKGADIHDDGRVYFCGKEQAEELSFIMELDQARISTLDTTNVDEFRRRLPFLTIQGLAHDAHVSTIFGGAALSTKTAEATFLFPAMIDRVIASHQTMGSTYEQPMERAHDLGKQKVSRRAVCCGGNGDPHKAREAGLRRVAVETAIQKKRRRSSREEVDRALVESKRIKIETDDDDAGVYAYYTLMKK